VAVRCGLWERVFSFRTADGFLDRLRTCVLACLDFSRGYHRLTDQCGAVAQLGARVNGIHEVAGSIPASSTKPRLRVPADLWGVIGSAAAG
jgi:hypothetical protein